jgi:hypothetical protein
VPMNALAEAQFHTFQLLPLKYILYNVFELFNTQHVIALELGASISTTPLRRLMVALIPTVASCLPKIWQPYWSKG